MNARELAAVVTKERDVLRAENADLKGLLGMPKSGPLECTECAALRTALESAARRIKYLESEAGARSDDYPDPGDGEYEYTGALDGSDEAAG